MDSLVLKLKEARDLYERANKASADAHHFLEETKAVVMNALKTSGKSKYELEGVAAIRVQSKDVFTTPKTNDEKRALFQYIQQKYGVDTCTAMLSINSNTLNAWANREVADDPALQIPGLLAPTSVETLYFTSKK